MIDLRRLAVLRAVAHHGTVTAAAEALYLTPSGASQQLRALGRELGVRLLEQDGRRVRLTAAAQELLVHADAIEERWEQAEIALRRDGTRPAGLLRLCGPPSALVALLAPATARLRAEHPALTVRITQAESPDGVDQVFSGAADLAVIEAAVGTPPQTDRRFEQQPLLTDPFDLLVPAGHPFTDRPGPVKLADAAAEEWVVEMSDHTSHDHTLAACAAAGFTPDIVHQAREWPAVVALVANGLGVSLLPRLAQLPDRSAAVRVPLAGTPPTRHLLTCIRAGTAAQPAIAAARAALCAVADVSPARPSPSPDQNRSG
ncbi:LysR family transcriptional regulator [Streptomyces sp. A7024]|uniref:LysR family transcriptional regulator n=1 Tax=Streptomyces coryli TaxID=1128680 RepID=A0A6G4TXL0_9ACTN|nr:LysR family transcriptional regulator [Streptomyces coryli]NGN64502.1 LysR family transcriptional regulator [Streptomyces coryli]